MTISVTEYQTRLRCPREHQYAYIHRREPFRKDSEALEIGTQFHEFLERYWLGQSYTDAVTGTTNPLIVGMAQAYARHWGSPSKEYEVIGVEQYFTSGQGHGYFDGLARDRGGHLFVVEHKTTSEKIDPASSYWTKLEVDPQVSLYYDAAAELLNEPVRGVLYDVVRKPTIRQKKGESNEAFANRCAAWCIGPDAPQRQIIVRTAQQLEVARGEVAIVTNQIENVSRVIPEPRNTTACMRYGRTCGYFAVCAGQQPLTDLPKRVKR